MTLYEIDKALAELIDSHTDPETGELIIEPYELETLQMAREEKLENIALFAKNLMAEAVAIKAETDKLTERRRSVERKAERMKELLSVGLAGEKFSTPRVAVSFRASKSLEIDIETFLPWAEVNRQYLRMKEPEPDKMAIKTAIVNGAKIPGAEIVEKRSVSIK